MIIIDLPQPCMLYMFSMLIFKSLQWLKIPGRIYYKVLSLTFNSLQSSQSSYLNELFTIKSTLSTRSSSGLSVSHPLVMHQSPLVPQPPRYTSVTAPWLKNDLQPELWIFEVLPPSLLVTYKHHLPLGLWILYLSSLRFCTQN